MNRAKRWETRWWCWMPEVRGRLGFSLLLSLLLAPGVSVAAVPVATTPAAAATGHLSAVATGYLSAIATRQSPRLPGSTGRTMPVRGGVDYQLGGSYRPDSGVSVVVRDITGHPARGVYSVCYINAFQTQPGSLSRRWHGRRHLLLHRQHGGLLRDPGWPDEVLLDTSSRGRRTRIARLLRRDVRRCARKGFDAIELDNLDSWTRSHHQLRSKDNLRLARKLARTAHRHGMLVAQKNAVEISRRAERIVGFDFAIAEDCHRWHECRGYRRVYGKRVIAVEYQRKAFRRACQSHHPDLVVWRDLDLVHRGEDGYRFAMCG